MSLPFLHCLHICFALLPGLGQSEVKINNDFWKVPKNIIALLDLFNTGSHGYFTFEHSMKAGVERIIMCPSQEVSKNYRDFSFGISRVLALLLI